MKNEIQEALITGATIVIALNVSYSIALDQHTKLLVIFAENEKKRKSKLQQQ